MLTKAEKELRKLKKLVREDCHRIYMAEENIDAIMKGPSTEQRGRLIAAMVNEITMARQSLLHFGLGIKLNELKEIKDEQTRTFKGIGNCTPRIIR